MAVRLQWEELTAHPLYKQLPLQERAKLRQDYFNDFVRPELPENAKIDAGWQAFNQSADKSEPEIERSWGEAATDAYSRFAQAGYKVAETATDLLQLDPISQVDPLYYAKRADAGFSEWAGGLMGIDSVREMGERRNAELDDTRTQEAERRRAAGEQTMAEEKRGQIFTGETFKNLGASLEPLISERQKQLEQQQSVAHEEGLGATVMHALSNPGDTLSTLTAQSLPYLVPGAMAGRLAGLAGRAAGVSEAVAANRALLASLGTDAHTIAMSSADGAAEALTRLPEEELIKNADYRAALQETKGDEVEARELLADRAWGTAYGTNLLTQAASLGIGQRLGLNVVENLAAGVGRKALGAGATKVGTGRALMGGAAKEFVGEFGEEMGDQFSQNAGEMVGGAREESKLFDGVLGSGFLGGFAAGPLGAMAGYSNNRLLPDAPLPSIDKIKADPEAGKNAAALALGAAKQFTPALPATQTPASTLSPSPSPAPQPKLRNGVEAGTIIDAQLAELDATAARLLPVEQVKTLQAESDEITGVLQRHDQRVKAGVKLTPQDTIEPELRTNLDARRVEIRQQLEAHRTAVGAQTRAAELRTQLGKIDKDSDLIALSERLSPSPVQTPVAAPQSTPAATAPAAPATVAPATTTAPALNPNAVDANGNFQLTDLQGQPITPTGNRIEVNGVTQPPLPVNPNVPPIPGSAPAPTPVMDQARAYGTPATNPVAPLGQLPATASEADLDAKLTQLTAPQQAVVDAPPVVKQSREPRTVEAPFQPMQATARKPAEFATVLRDLLKATAKDSARGTPQKQADLANLQVDDLSRYQEVELQGKDKWRIKQLEKVLGKRVVFISQYDQAGNVIPEMRALVTGSGGMTLSSRPDVMFVVAEGNKSPMAVIGHEFLHLLRQTDSNLYNQFRSMASARLRKNRIYEQRAQQYEGLDADSLEEEIFADFWGDLFKDENFWRELARREPGMFKQVMQEIINFLNALVAKAGFSTDKMFEDIKALKDEATSIFIKYSKDNVRGTVDESLDVQKQGRARAYDKAFAQPVDEDADEEMAEQMVFDKQPADPDQTQTPNFLRWSKGAPLYRNGKDYKGGPAIFVAYHGTTHPDIEVFERKGDKQGFLGEGPYFSTGREDVSENYAGMGQDLQVRIDLARERIFDELHDDPDFALGATRKWFAVNNILVKVSEKNLSDILARYANPISKHMATEQLKGDSDGLTMPVYVRMTNPASTVSNDQKLNREDGSLQKWFFAGSKVTKEYFTPSQAADYMHKVLAVTEMDGVTMREVLEVLVQMVGSDPDTGDSVMGGLIFAKIAEAAGYDGVIMDANKWFGGGRQAHARMPGVTHGTLHMVPFGKTQIKSAIGNNGDFSDADPNINRSRDFNEERQRQLDAPKVAAFSKKLGEEVREGAEKLRQEAEAGDHQYKAGDTVLFGTARQRVTLRAKAMVGDNRNIPEGLSFKERNELIKSRPKIPGWYAHSSGYDISNPENSVEGSWDSTIPEYAVHGIATGPTIKRSRQSVPRPTTTANPTPMPQSPLAVPVRQGYLGKARTYVERQAQKIERNFMDGYRDLREMQKYVESQIGQSLPVWAQPWRQENLRHGAFVDHREGAWHKYFEPVAKLLEANDLNRHAFEDYLWARHVPERDAFLRSRLDPNGPQPQFLAGMTPQEANDHIAQLDPHERTVYEQAATHMDGLRLHILETLRNSGQISADHHDNLLDQYQHYVPLRGLPEGSDPDHSISGVGTGKGLSTSSSPLGKRATGRVSPPSDILEELAHDLDRALIGAEKQTVLKQLLGLISLHPDKDLWEVSPVVPERKWVNGVLTMVDTRGNPADQLTYMHDGNPVGIEIRDPMLRKALLELDKNDMPAFLRWAGKLTRWLSTVKTAMNPYFIAPNMVRDLQFAGLGMTAEFSRKVVKDAMRLYTFGNPWGALAKDHHGLTMAQLRAGSPMLRHAREFAAQGGKTGYTLTSDINAQQDQLNELFTRYAKNKMSARTLNKARIKVVDFIENMNAYVENATRLSVYSALRENGMDPKTAAAYAKDVTVNFNRKGAYTRHMSAAYLFFNPAVQGTVRLVKLAKNKRAQALLGGMAMASYSVALYSMHAMGDDDDGESKYEKLVGDTASRRSITIPLGGDNKLTIPVAYGPNIFTHLGFVAAQATYRAQTGKRVRAGKLMKETLVNIAGSMSPLPAERGTEALQPEVLRVTLNLGQNENDFDGKISYALSENEKDKEQSNWTETSPTTAEGYKLAARVLSLISHNPLGEGTYADAWKGYESGGINATGEHLKYLTEQGLGGPAKFISQTWNLAEKLFIGDTDDLTPSDWPVVNSFLRTARTREQPRSKYYQNIDEYNHLLANYKQASGEYNEDTGDWIVQPDVDKMRSMLATDPWLEGAELSASTREGEAAQEGSLMEYERATKKAIKDLRNAAKALAADDSIPLLDRNRQRREMEEQIGELQKGFNRQYNRARGN